MVMQWNLIALLISSFIMTDGSKHLHVVIDRLYIILCELPVQMVPKTTPTFKDLPEDSGNSAYRCTRDGDVWQLCSERMVQSDRREKDTGVVWRDPAAGVLCPPPHKRGHTVKMGRHVRSVAACRSLSAPLTRGFHGELVHLAWCTCKFQTLGRKAGIRHKP